MAWAVIRFPRPDLILIYEHKPQYAAVLYLACLVKKVPVFFFVQGVQQTSNRSIFHRLGFRLLQLLVNRAQFWALFMERSDEGLPPADRLGKSILIPIPIPKRSGLVRPPVTGRKIRIGIMGMLRKEKPISRLLELVQNFVSANDGFELVVGTPAWQDGLDSVKGVGQILDTSTAEQYMQALESVDIVAMAFDRDSYYMRSSGLINDAVAAGCLVVVPDYPVFVTQLTVPCRVGRTYSDISQIGAAILLAAGDVREGRTDFECWRHYRDDEKLITELGAKILGVMESRKRA